MVGLTVPFPGNVYGAFRIARAVRRVSPATRIVLGGGYVNTELRELSDPRVFDYVDFVTLDAGETPILAILEHLAAPADARPMLRTFVRRGGAVALVSDDSLRDVPITGAGTPTYAGLALDRYLGPSHELVIAGPLSSAEGKSALAAIRGRFLPRSAIAAR